jgi:TolA-binding protein
MKRLSLLILLLSSQVSAVTLNKREVEVNNTMPVRPASPSSSPSTPDRPAPGLRVDEFINQRRERVQDINERQVAQLRRLIALSDDNDEQRPDYLFRLAELLTERYRFAEHRARSGDETIFQAEQKRDIATATRLRQEQDRDERAARAALGQAIEKHMAASRYGRYARLDEVLFRLGELLYVAERGAEARPFLVRLLKEFPQSRYVPNAYLSFAEDFFARGEMTSARDFYDKVAQFPTSSVFGFALYKRAWAEFNLGQTVRALDTLVSVIQTCQAGRISAAQRKPLEKEARRDLVRVFARTPTTDADKAWDFFRRLGADEAPHMLDMLAELYWEAGRAAASTRLYRKLMALDPQSTKVCVWQTKVLRNTLTTGSEAAQVQELTRLGQSYRHLRGQHAKTDVLTSCQSDYRDSAREMAFVLHKQAQRLKQLATYQRAAAAYREYLSAFEGEVVRGEVSFFYAECLWQIASLSPHRDPTEWSEAAEQYTRVVEGDPSGRYVKEAALAAVLAWQNAVYEDQADQPPSRSDLRRLSLQNPSE